ncbi:hypothetical protein HN832_04770 [archaeon]|jgi:hypothetical protein|nr:hypothetical protein [archaeon]MBT4374001.1 hypothetical protein [archaeon]MBT4532097.1 hypothetical protein [archaeon]MBT7001987.1 hypothetical protein [archaeon]MBT7282698.1 hypothetical protein [archaeon]
MEYKAYSFDLDDNLLKLPTKVFLEDAKGNLKEFSTLNFEKIRPQMKKLGFKTNSNSFKSFEDNKQFLKDIEKATLAGSWKNIETCLVKHASIFAIITARRHNPETLKQGIKRAILKNFSKEQLEKFSKKFIEKYSIKKIGNQKFSEKILDQYLELCKFYPVNNPEIKKQFNSEDTSELKSFAFADFQKYINNHVKENFGAETKIKIGFSDDSITHLNKMINEILKEHGLFFYQTKNKGKTLLS